MDEQRLKDWLEKTFAEYQMNQFWAIDEEKVDIHQLAEYIAGVVTEHAKKVTLVWHTKATTDFHKPSGITRFINEYGEYLDVNGEVGKDGQEVDIAVTVPGTDV